MTDNDRPQDVGRRHERKRSEGGANAALIERWHAELRTVLDRCIVELQPVPQPDGLHGPQPAKERSISHMTEVVKLGAVVSRELGGAIDPPKPAETSSRRPPAPRRVAYK